jgi:hypothetical protein
MNKELIDKMLACCKQGSGGAIGKEGRRSS